VNNNYKTKWSELEKEKKYLLSKAQENKLISFLITECGFKQIIPTRDSIYSHNAKNSGLILPDLLGVHNNGINYFIELKSKNRRMKYNDNGIDYDKAEQYLEVQEAFQMKVLLVFIDDEKEWIKENPSVNSWFKDEKGECTYYGNWIEKLYYETPENKVTITSDNKGTKIICFPLSNMRKIKDIFQERQTKLRFGIIE